MIARSDSDAQSTVPSAGGISHEAITAELHRITSSAAFGKAERPARFLRHLVETALRGDNSILKESILGMDVFGRPSTWDARLDPIVRQEATRLRKRLAAYYQTGGASDEVRIELPVGSYVPVFRRQTVEVESAPSIEKQVEKQAEEQVLQTAAPSGPVPTPPVEQAAAAPGRPIWAYAAAGVFCIGILALLLWKTPFRGEAPLSIVVLPFANLSIDPSNQYFADGLTDEITDSLARINKLRVIARSSAFRFKGKPVDVREAGRQLNVSHVVEGSVERSGDRVKIVAHLERVSDGSLLWSNTYERSASDLFATQTELAAGIAGNLKVAAGGAPARHVPNADAEDLVMKARYELQQMTPESLAQAEAEYHQAIDLDPQYAAPYMGLALAKYDRFVARGSSIPMETERRSTEQLLHKALTLNPELSSAHATLGLLALQYDWDWAGAEREFQLAVAGPPSPTVESEYAALLTFQGRFTEADRHIRRAAELDPFSNANLNNFALVRVLEGRFAEAREIAQREAVQSPDMIAPQQVIGGAYIAEGRPDLALPVFKRLEPRFPQIRAYEAAAYAKAGQREVGLRLIRPFEEKYPNPGIPMQWVASFYAFMGDESNTLKWLERSADRHEWQVLYFAVNPVYAPMRNSPGFVALKRRIGLGQ